MFKFFKRKQNKNNKEVYLFPNTTKEAILHGDKLYLFEDSDKEYIEDLETKHELVLKLVEKQMSVSSVVIEGSRYNYKEGLINYLLDKNYIPEKMVIWYSSVKLEKEIIPRTKVIDISGKKPIVFFTHKLEMQDGKIKDYTFFKNDRLKKQDCYCWLASNILHNRFPYLIKYNPEIRENYFNKLLKQISKGEITFENAIEMFILEYSRLDTFVIDKTPFNYFIEDKNINRLEDEIQ